MENKDTYKQTKLQDEMKASLRERWRDVPSQPMPATYERLQAFIQARHAFYGSLLMGLLTHHLSAAAGDEGVGAGKGGEFDVLRQGWEAFEGTVELGADDAKLPQEMFDKIRAKCPEEEGFFEHLHVGLVVESIDTTLR